MEKSGQFIDHAAGRVAGHAGEAITTACSGKGAKDAAPHMCKCGRAPWRVGQRNCVLCNREANRKYRESLKREEERAQSLPLQKKPLDSNALFLPRALGCGRRERP